MRDYPGPVLIKSVSLSNFRRLDGLNLDLDGEHLILTGANGSGKSSLITAIAAALGQRVSIGLNDFTRVSDPIEIKVVLSEVTEEDQREFGDHVTLGPSGGPAQMTVGFTARWDEDTEAIVSKCAFPTMTWAALTRRQREALPVLWLPAWRAPNRLLSAVGRASLLANLLRGLDLETAKSEAAEKMTEAVEVLLQDAGMKGALEAAGLNLGALVPLGSEGPLQLVSGPGEDLLAQVKLAVDDGGGTPPIEIDKTSSGLAQLAVFAVLIELIRDQPKILLVDEPEISLHPTAQRATINRLTAAASQLVVASHAPGVLDRQDVRRIGRLKRVGESAIVKRPEELDEVAAARYARLIDPRSSEAVFASRLVLVEGASDRLAVYEVARLLGIDLDARGVVILDLGGAGRIKLALSVFGPEGLDVDLAGLVDADHEENWIKELGRAGFEVTDRTTLAAADFFVCDPDLEDVLVAALGDEAGYSVVEAEGMDKEFADFENTHPDLGRTEALTEFCKGDKVRWAPLLAAASGTAPPTPTSLHQLVATL